VQEEFGPEWPLSMKVRAGGLQSASLQFQSYAPQHSEVAHVEGYTILGGFVVYRTAEMSGGEMKMDLPKLTPPKLLQVISFFLVRN
jgi:hypothetical protein